MSKLGANQVNERPIIDFDLVFYNVGYLMQGINEDCITIQQAIGDKMGMFIFFISTFFSGITIGRRAIYTSFLTLCILDESSRT